MSQMTKCDEGHFYDKSQNTKCPFCGVGNVDLTKKYIDDGASPTIKFIAAGKEDDKTKMYTASGDTRQFGSSPGSSDPDATVAVWKKSTGIDPVAGWLVCHEGANQGRDYRIRSGFNNIGRDTSSQICIAGDETIAREEHAKIFYDVKNANFHVLAGSGRSGVYVNNQVVLQPTVLKAYDILEIGSTKLMFVPFCGDKFRWDIGDL
jgi:hypothetical protein